MSKRNLVMITTVAVVLASGLVVALSDAGLPLPLALVAGAGVVLVAAVVAAGVVGYRRSRAQGIGVWRSLGRGLRQAIRTVFDLV